MRKFTVVGLGEILWDVFPEHEQLGGAPANFAYISSLLGEEAVVASRIGTDGLGKEIIERLQGLELDVSYLQRDPAHTTGTVKVEVAADGQPRFEITKNVAWDFLEWTADLKGLAAKVDAVCFGSLAQRGARTRDTIGRFLAATRKDAVRVFDVNLRQSFYSPEILAASAERSHILKLNHEEVPLVMNMLGAPKLDELQATGWLCQRFGLKLVCITRGASGSLLASADAHHEHPGHCVVVADTVGSGDAFTATLVHHFLRGSSLEVMNDAANRMGAWVASRPGAMPAADVSEIEKSRAQGD